MENIEGWVIEGARYDMLKTVLVYMAQKAPDKVQYILALVLILDDGKPSNWDKEAIVALTEEWINS